MHYERDRSYHRDHRGYHDRNRDRDRDRRRYQPRRSKTPEYIPFNRNISLSRDKSRALERRRRKAQAECIKRAGGFQRLADSEGHETVRLFWDGFQWVAKTEQLPMIAGDPSAANSTRKLRRLYFGNLPLHLGLTEDGFKTIVTNEMKSRGFFSDPNVDPVVYVWFSNDKGNYGFVEFNTIEETEKALTMDGMNCMGVQLRISRPNDYSTNTLNTNTFANLSVPSMFTTYSLPAVPAFPPGATAMHIVQIANTKEMKDEHDWIDMLDDVKSGFDSHGKVVHCAAILPEHTKDGRLGIVTAGDVVLEFVNNAALTGAVQNMTGRKYEGRPVQMRPIDSNVYEIILKEIVPIQEKLLSELVYSDVDGEEENKEE